MCGIKKIINSSLLLLLAPLLISCNATRQNVNKHNYFNEDYFYNDSLKIAIDFWGALNFINPTERLRHRLKSEGIKSIDNNKLFLVCESKANKYKMYFFCDSIKSPTDYQRVNQKITSNDTVNKIVLFEKSKGHIKITGIIKSEGSDKEYSLNLAQNIISKIAIDSVDEGKLSLFKVWSNYAVKRKNQLQARKKIMTLPLTNNQKGGLKSQFVMTANSFISENHAYTDLIKNLEQERKIRYKDLISKISEHSEIKKNQGVFDEISQLAKNNSVIILNEDHYYPKHRIFAMQLLDVLKLNGFTNISLEAFTENDKFTPNYSNGFYTGEPYFAHFIRKAKEMGFIITGHESTDNNIDRELGQAKNIAKIFDQNSKAKIFVYVGHSHIEKGNNGKKWMAQYFKEQTNIDPITINQVSICADLADELILIPKQSLVGDSIPRSNADFFVINNIKTDLQKVYFDKIFQKFILRNSLFKSFKSEEVLISVFDMSEYLELKELAIPIVNFLQIPESDKIKLNLPSGKYHVVVRTEDNKELSSNNIEVN